MALALDAAASASLRGVERLRAHPRLSAGLSGVALTLAMPPLSILPSLLGFAVLVHLLAAESKARRGFLLGFTFGLGYFIPGLYWVGIAFFADAERHGWLAVPGVLALSAVMAASVGAAAWAAVRLRCRTVETLALSFAIFWTLNELFHELVIGFPWIPVATAWTATDLTLQAVAGAGTYGLSMLTVAAAGLLARFLEPGTIRRWPALVVPLLFLVGLIGGSAWRLAQAPAPNASGLPLRLVQAAIPQDLKWDRERAIGWFRRHLELSLTPSDTPPGVVIWPESAVPFQLTSDADARAAIASILPPGATALVGGDYFVIKGDRIAAASNSLFALDDRGELLGRYDKVDLVPFGEFTPYRWLFSTLGFGKLVSGTFDFSPGPARQTMSVAGVPPFSPLICFEAVFPNDAAPLDPRPAWLLNITNDAWFGISSGPYQHLAMARMRAVEEGLPLVRAANTGISVVTDAYGRITARLGLGEMGVLDATLPPPLAGPSFARRLGWLLPVGIAFIFLIVCVMVEIRARRHA